ncbi:protein GAMETE EXPRESSED 2 isoform X3 [Arabidopsis lyrata subsp. lyrata]|uniref:protein GAMETE EXPRESSED 2 isoform X3 n=1 Tax=Arabidopsis lyrata subsp. lyrata TaxID=81972 RepID=UPI000A29C716|nr:protein GAMETE EXPRESSED 2 isoform X3 [Arabidopsis lyrata subsp. lyrata]|eukprot:XP_020877406.1 protein GAMETE EXPRESSED 2 isoform X3 [Arabidopsis lyrata subsp. lyrata]
MAIKFASLLTLFFFIAISISESTDESGLPKFTFSWSNDKNKFKSGEIAEILIKVLGNFDSHGNASLGQRAFKPTVTVNAKIGNSSYISGVYLDLGEDISNWKIYFTPIMVGIFNIVIDDENFKVLDSSLHFEVEPGLMYPSVSVVSWMGLANVFEAGMNASILILPKDAFGNNISFSGKEMEFQGFSLSLLNENGSIAAGVLNITHIRWIESGYISIEFVLVTTGKFLLLVEKESQTLNGVPLPLEVNSGPLDVSNCVSIWKSELNTWQIFSKMEILLHQKDRFGNLVSGFYEFDADVVEIETGLSIPVADFQFEYVEPGIQLMSFSLSEPGNFLLTLSDMKHNKSIASMPYLYTVYIGYCDGSRSIVNGSGINASIAGESLAFSIYLKDAYGYPSSIQVDRLQVRIVLETDSSFILPTIQPREALNGTGSSHQTATPLYEKHGGIASGSLPTQASIFDVTYTPKRSGIYRILISSGNIVLNGGQPFIKEVYAGEVNVAACSVTQFNAKVPKEIKNDVVVLLLDGFYNPVPSQSSRLKLEITSANTSSFTTWEFVDNNDGTYTGSYLAMEVGTYRMCISFDNKHIEPCPFDVNVYSNGYFPRAYDDPVNVWEDESISFNPLENDYFAGDNASMLGFSQPGHGSLLRDGNVLRYTPIKDFSGNDSFLYTIADINGNLAAATVYIFVLTAPPQFVSFSGGLQATEDLISPRYGQAFFIFSFLHKFILIIFHFTYSNPVLECYYSGFSGLEISYSDLLENISVTVQALSGSVILSPMLMQFRPPASGRLSVSNGGEDGKVLILEGQIGVINPALQSIQYLGNENFAGVDSLRLSTKNKNGINHLDVPVFVEPVNDPPFINVPQYIMLESNGSESLIFHPERHKFNFSVGDPDLVNFPGGESHFLVTFSVEVTDGFLLTNLPSELINSTELKFKNMFQWQPIQTYAAISKHVNVKASGIRFRGTIKQCNDLMQQLLHRGGENGAVLTLKLSDMGNYGCFLDCTERISLPLHAKARVNLIRKRPLSSLGAHVLGSVIVVESLVVFSLATLLLFFTCKCAFLLVHERRSEKNSQKPTDNAELLNSNVSTRTITGCLLESIWHRHTQQRHIGETSGNQSKQSSPEINIFRSS